MAEAESRLAARHGAARRRQRGSARAADRARDPVRASHRASSPRSSQEELESHERDRRRALHEVADRLRQRERELRERVAAEEAEAIQRIQAGFADIERRQLDQLKRVVERTAASFLRGRLEAVRRRRSAARATTRRSGSHASSTAPSTTSPRRRRASWPSGSPTSPTPAASGSSASSRRSARRLEHERDELVAELQRRIGDAEVELRSQVQALAADAEAERTVLNARLQDLQRRIDEALSEAGSRLSPTFRGTDDGNRQTSAGRVRLGQGELPATPMTQIAETPRDEQAKVESWRLHVLMEAGYPLPLAEKIAHPTPTCTTRSSSLAPGLHARDRRRDPDLDASRLVS